MKLKANNEPHRPNLPKVLQMIPGLPVWPATAQDEVNGIGQSPRLTGQADYEVAVIGAGFTGLSAAVHLAERGYSVCVIDAHDIGWGASGRAGGQVNPMLPVATPDELFACLPQPFAERLANLSLGSADFLFSLIRRHQIRCDARQTGWLRAHHSEKARQQAELSAQKWAIYGAEMRITEAEETAMLTGTTTYRSATLTPSGGLVHPLKLAIGMAQTAQRLGAEIFGFSPVEQLQPAGAGWHVHTPEGCVTCRAVIFATNGYSGLFDGDKCTLQPRLKASLLPAGPIQIATDPLDDELANSLLPKGHSISDTRRMIMYARREPDNRFIFGGIGQRRLDGRISGYDWLMRDARRIFPQLHHIDWPYRWSGQIALTETHLPQLNKLAPGVIAGLGYNGRGVAMAHVMGKILADYVSGTDQHDLPLPVLPPRRMPLRMIKQLGMGPFISVARALDWLDSRR